MIKDASELRDWPDCGEKYIDYLTMIIHVNSEGLSIKDVSNKYKML